MSLPPPSPHRARSPVVPLLGIAAIAGGIAIAFAWTAGWIGGDRLTAARMTDTIESAGRRIRATGVRIPRACA